MSQGLDERGLPPGYLLKADWEVTPREVHRVRQAEPERLFLLDIRREEEWNLCHISGAHSIPMKELALRTDELEGLCGGTGREIVVNCQTGRQALWAVSYLRQAGFANCKSMAGGIDLWAYDIDPSIPRYPRASTGRLAFEFDGSALNQGASPQSH